MYFKSINHVFFVLVVINYALIVMDAFVKNCGRPFVVELSSRENTEFLRKFLMRETLAPENRGRLLEIIADWAEHIQDPPGIRMFFHRLVGEGTISNEVEKERVVRNEKELRIKGKIILTCIIQDFASHQL